MLDLLVIGAGLSGMMAAHTAAKAGLRTRVIAKGLGSMHWGAGTVDLLGYLPGDETAVENPLASLDDLRAAHPYRQLGAEMLTTALDEFQRVVAALGLPYTGASTPGRNLLLPSPIGAARPAYLAPVAQLGGELRDDAPILVVGFHGLRDFYPELIAENLTKLGHPARAAFLPLSLITERRDSNTVQLATFIEAEARGAKIGAVLKELARPGERIGLPAILGVDEHAQTFATIQEACGTTIFEIPTLPPSVPGIRLHTALRTALKQQGVRVEAGMEAIGFDAKAGRVRWVETETSSRPLKHRAENYLLATGGVLGGGFNSDQTGRVWEVIFDLPLTVPQNRGDWFRPEFLDPTGQPVFNGGIAVDEHFQPVDGSHKPGFENLWVAGGALAHADPILERSLEGIALVTGMAAANDIAVRAKQESM